MRAVRLRARAPTSGLIVPSQNVFSDAADSGLSIVIPAYNEAERIGRSLRIVCAYLKQAGHDAEVLVVDDGSTDRTPDLARDLLAAEDLPYRVLTGRSNRGKGYSVREGARAASRPWTLISDADLSTPIAEVERLLAAARKHSHDLVVGSRGLPESRIGVQQNWLRMNMGRTFNLCVRLLTRLSLRDTQCGFKLWRTETVRPLLERLQIDGFAWDVELLMKAHRAGMSIGEVAVEWNDVHGSKVGLLRDPLHMLRDLIWIRLHR
ncbi:MAG: dolichyl-phosphate beta-glucosyltransferase [Acidobacteriota bacterium]